MPEFINLPTLLVGAAVLLLLAGIATKLIRDKRKGKTSCGCNCADCPSRGMCHPEAKDSSDSAV